MGTGTLTAGNLTVGNITAGSLAMGTGTLTAGNISVGTITASSLNLTTNGTITVGTIATNNFLTIGSVSTTSIYIPSTTTSTNSATGALIVSGGAGIAGSLYVGGSIYMNGVLVGTGGGGTGGSGSSNFGTNPLTAGSISVNGNIAVGGNTTVSGLVSNSPYYNVNTFSSPSSGGLYITNSVNVFNSLFIAGGSYNGTTIAGYSSNGSNYTNITGLGSGSILSIAFGSGIWVAVGGANAYYSNNGTTWTSVPNIVGGANVYTVAYGNGQFVLGGASATAAYSTNGSSWTTFTLNSLVTAVYGLAYGNGYWGAVAYDNGQFYQLYSTTGITTFNITFGQPSALNTIAYVNGFWLCGTSNVNNLTQSSSASSLPGSAYITGLNSVLGIAYGNGYCVIVGASSGNNGSIAYATSTGTGFNAFTLVSNSVALIGSTGTSVTYGNGQFIAVGSGTGTAVSTNGTTWTAGGTGPYLTGNTVAFGYGSTVVGNTSYSVTMASYQNTLVVSGNLNIGTNALTSGPITATNISVSSTTSATIASISLTSGSIFSSTINSGTTGTLTTGTINVANILQTPATGNVILRGQLLMATADSTINEFVAGGSGTTNTLAYASNSGTVGQTMGSWSGNLNTIFTTQVNQIINFTSSAGVNTWVAVGQGTNTLAYSYDGINWTGLSTTIFNNNAITVAAGILYSSNSPIGVYVFAYGTSANTNNYGAGSIDGVNWFGFGTTLTGSGAFNPTTSIDTSCKVVYLYDSFIFFGGGSYNNIQVLNYPSWVNMGTGFSSLGMTIKSLTWTTANAQCYVAVGSGATHTMAYVSYSGGGTGSATYLSWTGLNTTVFSGSGIAIASYNPGLNTAYTYAVGTNSGGQLVVAYNGAPNLTYLPNWSTSLASSVGISTLSSFTGITAGATLVGSTIWFLIFGTASSTSGNTLYYVNNNGGALTFSNTTSWTGTLGTTFSNGTSSTCNTAILGTATFASVPICTITTTGNMTVSGNVSIGGNIFCSKGIAYVGSIQNTSDYRIKANVELLGSDFSVSKLVPVKYYNKLLRKDDVGFIAHEVQEVFPQFVEGEKDGEDYQSVNYTGLIAILVKEIQQLKKENQEIRRFVGLP